MARQECTKTSIASVDRDEMMTREELEQACRTIAATCPCSTVRLASRAITGLYDRVLAPWGLHCGRRGLSRFGTTMTTLGKVLGIDRTLLSRNLRPLQQRLITTVPGSDRCKQALRTTAPGERLLARTIPNWQRAQQQVLTVVGSEKWEALGGDLRGLARSVRAHHRGRKEN